MQAGSPESETEKPCEYVNGENEFEANFHPLEPRDDVRALWANHVVEVVIMQFFTISVYTMAITYLNSYTVQ